MIYDAFYISCIIYLSTALFSASMQRKQQHAKDAARNCVRQTSKLTIFIIAALTLQFLTITKGSPPISVVTKILLCSPIFTAAKTIPILIIFFSARTLWLSSEVGRSKLKRTPPKITAITSTILTFSIITCQYFARFFYPT